MATGAAPRATTPGPRGVGKDSRPTIVGVATGTPDGGVAVVRLSGVEAGKIAIELVGSLPAPRMLARRGLRLADGVEDALVVWMPAPRSFTGEDVVELHVHAGGRNVRSVVAAVLARGAVAAEAGEFSRRAFEEGRLGLDQVEGIAALIAAQTDAAVEQARRLVAGELGREVEVRVAEIHALRCEVEAGLDFPEDVSAGELRRWSETLTRTIGELQIWLRRFAAGQRSRERTRVVLAGPPNAGKSSLFNALLERERAIVSPLPGTTRDYVEATLEIAGREVVLVDTAGLRVAENSIEDAGIARSREQIGGADLLVWIEAADVEESQAPEEAVLKVENKRDLGCRRATWVGASAKGSGVEEVRVMLGQWIEAQSREPWIGLARHRDRVDECVAALVEAQQLVDEAGPSELIGFQLAIAERRLAEVSGRGSLGPVGEEVLGSIFSRFCIGK